MRSGEVCNLLDFHTNGIVEEVLWEGLTGSWTRRQRWEEEGGDTMKSGGGGVRLKDASSPFTFRHWGLLFL